MAGATVIDDDLAPAAFADAAGIGDAPTTTTIEDLPADVLALVLRRLDGASLAAVGCACSAFRDLAADMDAWRELCLARWPAVRDAVAVLGAGGGKGDHYRQLFADAFPFPALPAAPSYTTLPTRLVSAVDLHHGDACIMSRVVETDASSNWFLGAPFRVDALVQEGFSSPSPIAPAELSLTWLLIDPSSGRALNASSRRPVAVDRSWLTGDTVARFAVVLGGGGVALDAAVTFDERCGHVREVSLRVEDAEGGGARRGRGAEATAKERYEEFVRRKTARKERKATREGVIELCCSGVGAAAFLGFLVMLTFR